MSGGLRGRLQGTVNRRWYEDVRGPGPILRGLSRCYGAVADRRAGRQKASAADLPLPVVVVGNLTAGGAGKTPLTLSLAQLADAAGLRVGIVSRGYGARLGGEPHIVDPERDSAAQVGDEPLLMARRLRVPVCIARARGDAVQRLAAEHALDLVLADDGLQHYRLPRKAEICVIDGARGLGNGWRLPAGPLREPESRLADCDLVVVNGSGARGEALAARWQAARFELVLDELERLADGSRRPLGDLAGQPVHALAGIAHPERFFEALRGQGLRVHGHALADHQPLRLADCVFGDGLPVLMTEKDAVKLPARLPAGEAGLLYAVPAQALWRDNDAERARALLCRAAGRPASG